MYKITLSLKRALAPLNKNKIYPGHGRVWVRTWADGVTWIGIKHSNVHTLPLYEALKARCRELGYVVSNEGKPGTEGEQSFEVKPKYRGDKK